MAVFELNIAEVFKRNHWSFFGLEFIFKTSKKALQFNDLVRRTRNSKEDKIEFREFRPENDQPFGDDGICVCHGPSGHVIRPGIGHVLGGLGLHLFHGEAAAEPRHLYLLDEHRHLAAQVANLFLQFGVLSEGDAQALSSYGILVDVFLVLDAFFAEGSVE